MFYFVFEEADLRVRVVSSSSESSVLRCDLGKLVCLRCVLAGMSEGTRESKNSSGNSL